MSEGEKHESFRIHSRLPWCGEPPLSRLAGQVVTPIEDFYVHAVAAVPRIDAGSYILEVSGMVERPLTLHHDDLPILFPEVEVLATLLSAGHRRNELDRVRMLKAEPSWEAGAVGTARWRGVPLASVLNAAGVLDGARWVELVGRDEVDGGEEPRAFAGSIPLDAALDGSTLLAYEMNGEPLLPLHGFPLRAVVSGFVGARSVKWLDRIEVRSEPTPDPIHRLLPPQQEPSTGSSEGFALGEHSVTSFICSPVDGAELEIGMTLVEGFALAGGRRTIERVDVSADQGSSWVMAELEIAPPGVWRQWRAELELRLGAHEIVVRAWDSAANSQPEDAATIWNPGGFMNNAWHRVRVWAG